MKEGTKFELQFVALVALIFLAAYLVWSRFLR